MVQGGPPRFLLICITLDYTSIYYIDLRRLAHILYIYTLYTYDASLEEGFRGDGPITFERKFYI